MDVRRILAGLGVVVGAAVAARNLVRLRRRIDFADRVVVITGGSRGLGLLIARELVDEGARVTLVARSAADLEVARAELIARTDKPVEVAIADVAQRDQLEGVIKATAASQGRLDVLINCAGMIRVGPLEHMSREDFERAFATHLWGPYYAMQAALPIMRAQGEGRIVNVSSIGGQIALPHLAPYVASKFALRGLSDAVGDEVARDGIRVTTVCPGLMRTGSHVNAEFKGQHEAEYAWFAAASGVPLLAAHAGRAARRIVRACRYGDRRVTIGAPARIAVLANALAPEIVSEAMVLVNRWLPAPSSSPQTASEVRSGWASRASWNPSVLVHRADRVVAEHNELRGHTIGELDELRTEE
jgi:NAD(P)-dependent dehydrogenase (short-subunit alcohol dehydrogenase family)